MIHKVETAGAVDRFRADIVCIVVLGSCIINMIGLGFIFFCSLGLGLGVRFETIEESELD